MGSEIGKLLAAIAEYPFASVFLLIGILCVLGKIVEIVRAMTGSDCCDCDDTEAD